MKSHLFLGGLTVCLLLFSCNKKSEAPNCLAVIEPLNLKFNLVDKESKMDLFFAENPTYEVSAIKIYQSFDIKHEHPLKFVVESNQGEENFSIVLDDFLTNNNQSNSLTFVIGTTINDQLDYSVYMTNTPCPGYNIKEIKFNKTVITSNKGTYTFTITDLPKKLA